LNFELVEGGGTCRTCGTWGIWGSASRTGKDVRVRVARVVN